MTWSEAVLLTFGVLLVSLGFVWAVLSFVAPKKRDEEDDA